MLNRLFISVSVFVGVTISSAPAGTFYISQNASGDDTGTSIANTKSLAWLNNASNWNGAGKISPGDRVHLVGTVTNILTIHANGTAGNPITIYFEPGAKLSAPTLPANSKWINLDGRSWITIDGGSNGVIECTDNGTLVAKGGTCTFQNPVTGIYGAGTIVNNITLKNLTIRNLYRRQVITDTSKTVIGTYLVGSDVTYTNLYIDGCQGGIVHSYGATATSNVTITASTITNYNHAIEIGCGQSVNPQLHNLTIHRNTFQSGDSHESPNGVELGLHRNAIFLFNESASGGFNGGVFTGFISNIVISRNFIRHGVNPQSTAAGTGAMFFNGYNSISYVRVRVFNNISTLAEPLRWSGGGGMIAAGGTDIVVANNTAVGWQANGTGKWYGSEISISGTNAFLYNNLLQSDKGASVSTYAITSNLTSTAAQQIELYKGIVIDRNVYNFTTFSGTPFYGVIFTHNTGALWNQWFNDTWNHWTNSGTGGRPADSRALAWDLNSSTNLVSLDANYVPLSSDTVAVGKGINLTAFGITNDFMGNPRPATGPWTIGAHETPSNAPFVSLAASPSTIVDGQTATLTWSSANVESVELIGFGLLPLNGSTNVSPSKPTTYTISATAQNGARSNSVSVTVYVEPPILRSVTPFK